MKGKVKFFDSVKGFGFVKGDDDEEYFVHVTALEPGTVLRDDDVVTFDVVEGDRGPKADNVKLASGEAAADDSDDDEDDMSDADEESDDDGSLGLESLD